MDIKIDGKLLGRYRKKRKRTQEWLAQAIDIDRTAICRWEQGEIPKTWKHYAAVCEALEIEQADLLSRTAKDMYSWLLVSYEEALIDGKPLEVARLSAQVLSWERFFTAGNFVDEGLDDQEIASVDKTERELAAMLIGKP